MLDMYVGQMPFVVRSNLSRLFSTNRMKFSCDLIARVFPLRLNAFAWSFVWFIVIFLFVVLSQRNNYGFA